MGGLNSGRAGCLRGLELPSALVDRLFEEELDLAVDRPEIFLRPSVQLRPEFRIDPEEKRFSGFGGH
jgi:hypothetical protein